MFIVLVSIEYKHMLVPDVLVFRDTGARLITEQHRRRTAAFFPV